ncbi:hypothetical protein CJ030_MR5G023017 [Morella rubra]|uniref:Uncharacterized protein n=1 Tax=Morella rubra TaxID=262757 RepID=A0A6A1VNN1_9ROSI|nr:hypothetical protein CJ030_MR5G023017 [Morella rubra]
MKIEAQSTSKEGPPYGNLLIKMIMDVRVDATRYEPNLMQLGTINNGTSAPRRLSGMTRAQQDIRALLESEHSILHAVAKAIAPIISTLAAIEKRLEKIELMQLELKKTNDEARHHADK